MKATLIEGFKGILFISVRKNKQRLTKAKTLFQKEFPTLYNNIALNC